MEKEIRGSYKKACSISREVREYAKGLIKEGEKVLEIAEKIEKKIEELGGEPAFPVNISINEITAHYSPDINDTTIIKNKDLVKVDIGVHVDGYIWDSAFTVCVNEKTHPLIEVSRKALDEALKLIKPGTKVYEISEVVENIITENGFNPVRNLCGHGLERFNQHASPTIPNGKNSIQDEIKEGQVVAMEVFVTNGCGWVKESFPVLIYKYNQDKSTRLPEGRKILELAKTKFKKLPFSRRWLAGTISPLKIDLALKQLVEIDALIEYPVLKEITGGLVAQSEETVIVE
ncbi:MAG: type II methionyl aminopeptidase [Candidatus Aenigmarchaeota archaeon]|nr:type II methionyl aminopeptidase [Candidatus Aenigmarchaeota archaeon]